MNPDDIREDVQETAAEHSPPDATESNSEQVAAWEEIEAGRYMPRRIRGSCRGRALG
jgi:hypothetical protein